MTDRGKHSKLTTTGASSPIEEAYHRIAQLHYVLATADAVSDTLHRRAVDDLMDVLEILEPSMPPRGDARSVRSTEL
jgi:hypothetical protein